MKEEKTNYRADSQPSQKIPEDERILAKASSVLLGSRECRNDLALGKRFALSKPGQYFSSGGALPHNVRRFVF